MGSPDGLEKHPEFPEGVEYVAMGHGAKAIGDVQPHHHTVSSCIPSIVLRDQECKVMFVARVGYLTDQMKFGLLIGQI